MTWELRCDNDAPLPCIRKHEANQTAVVFVTQMALPATVLGDVGEISGSDLRAAADDRLSSWDFWTTTYGTSWLP